VPIAGFIGIAVFAAFFGVVAAMLPARRASKLDILRAVGAE
jgi:ABC-type antimicrobial peptide transport system permease subunit